jgi:hypothetical protein
MVSMANKTYGTVSPERQKEMSGREFVKGVAGGALTTAVVSAWQKAARPTPRADYSRANSVAPVQAT